MVAGRARGSATGSVSLGFSGSLKFEQFKENDTLQSVSAEAAYHFEDFRDGWASRVL